LAVMREYNWVETTEFFNTTMCASRWAVGLAALLHAVVSTSRLVGGGLHQGLASRCRTEDNSSERLECLTSLAGQDRWAHAQTPLASSRWSWARPFVRPRRSRRKYVGRLSGPGPQSKPRGCPLSAAPLPRRTPPRHGIRFLCSAGRGAAWGAMSCQRWSTTPARAGRRAAWYCAISCKELPRCLILLV
jgi:hypothetical protein